MEAEWIVIFFYGDAIVVKIVWRLSGVASGENIKFRL